MMLVLLLLLLLLFSCKCSYRTISIRSPNIRNTESTQNMNSIQFRYSFEHRSMLQDSQSAANTRRISSTSNPDILPVFSVPPGFAPPKLCTFQGAIKDDMQFAKQICDQSRKKAVVKLRCPNYYSTRLVAFDCCVRGVQAVPTLQSSKIPRGCRMLEYCHCSQPLWYTSPRKHGTLPPMTEIICARRDRSHFPCAVCSAISTLGIGSDLHCSS